MKTPAFRDAKFWMLAGALVLALTALLVPQIERERQVYDLLAVVDITGSMNTRDMRAGGNSVSRLEASRRVLQKLLTELPCQSRLGLGVFTERRTFLLIDPVEVCGNFAALDGAIDGLDWRMAWEGDSYVAKGIYDAIGIAASLNSGLLFLTDGHEAPPLPASGLPEFEGKPGDVTGLIVGVGGKAKSPIPKYDDDGQEIGSWGASDVPHDNRVGAPPKGAEKLPGYHPKWAPFGSAAPVGEEHLSSVRTDHLKAVAARTGLAYAELAESADLMTPLRGGARTRPIKVASDIRAYPAGLALAILAALYGLAPLLALARPAVQAGGWQFPIFTRNKRTPLMKTFAAPAFAFACLLVLAPALHAHGPTPHKVEETVAIAAPPAAVWAAVKDFNAISAWHPGVAKSAGEGGNGAGATRTVTLKSGGDLQDGLDEYNEAEMNYSYRLAKENVGALPVSFYSATLTVKPAGGGSEVEWIGRFYRGDTGNFPPENLNDEAATKAMTAFFREGLDALKTKLEAKP
jgi:mxaL protein